MTDKELHRLRRDDLLQILISQQRQIDELNAALEKDESALKQRAIAVEEAGSVAEAALRLNGVFEAAQAAADQYQEQMRARADELAQKAEREAGEAKRIAEDVVRTARAEAERILNQARAEAERLLSEARERTGEAPAPIQAPEAPEEGKRRRGLFGKRRDQ